MCVCVCEVSHGGGGAAVAERAPGSLIPDQRVSRASGPFFHPGLSHCDREASGPLLGTQGPGRGRRRGWVDETGRCPRYSFIPVMWKEKVLSVHCCRPSRVSSNADNNFIVSLATLKQNRVKFTMNPKFWFLSYCCSFYTSQLHKTAARRNKRQDFITRHH